MRMLAERLAPASVETADAVCWWSRGLDPRLCFP
jgi:hypothetical protein